MAKLLVNLVGNALKFTVLQGEVVVEVMRFQPQEIPALDPLPS